VVVEGPASGVGKASCPAGGGEEEAVSRSGGSGGTLCALTPAKPRSAATSQ